MPTLTIEQLLVVNELNQHLFDHEVTIRYFADMARTGLISIPLSVVTNIIDSGRMIDAAKQEFLNSINKEHVVSMPKCECLHLAGRTCIKTFSECNMLDPTKCRHYEIGILDIELDEVHHRKG